MKSPFSTLRHRRGWLLAVGLGCATPLLAETLPRGVATFEVGVEVVNLDLAVTDPRDRHISDLGEQEVVVFEDGVRQQICLFTREQLPISLTIVLDSSASMKPRLPVAQAAALRLLRTLRPGDEAEVANFNKNYVVQQALTSDKALLEAAVSRIEAEGETALYNALYIALNDLASRRKTGELRRRAVVILSDGEDTASLLTDDQVMERARRADISVYPIGLMTQLPTPSSDTGLPIFFLTSLARETGGRAYFPAVLDELDGVYDRIAQELRTLYGLGYVSSNPRRDGGWRRIAVQMLRQNLVVRHRPGYYAARPLR